MEEVARIQGNFFLVSRLDQRLDFNEFKKVCLMIPGRPKTFFSFAYYSQLVLKKQVLIGGFENPVDKRAFASAFRQLYPDYWLHEVSKIIKFFHVTALEDSYTEPLLDNASDIVTKYTKTGAEALASDYKLLKTPLMQPYLGL